MLKYIAALDQSGSAEMETIMDEDCGICAMACLFRGPKIVSEYDQEIPQSQSWKTTETTYSKLVRQA